MYSTFHTLPCIFWMLHYSSVYTRCNIYFEYRVGRNYLIDELSNELDVISWYLVECVLIQGAPKIPSHQSEVSFCPPCTIWVINSVLLWFARFKSSHQGSKLLHTIVSQQFSCLRYRYWLLGMSCCWWFGEMSVRWTWKSTSATEVRYKILRNVILTFFGWAPAPPPLRCKVTCFKYTVWLMCKLDNTGLHLTINPSIYLSSILFSLMLPSLTN